LPSQEGFLHHVLGLGDLAQHAVSDPEQQGSVLLKRLHRRRFGNRRIGGFVIGIQIVKPTFSSG
jgi:hypothetical protein